MASFPWYFALHQKVPQETSLIKSIFPHSSFYIRTLLVQRVPGMQLFKVVCLGHYFYRLHIVSCAVIRGIAGTF